MGRRGRKPSNKTSYDRTNDKIITMSEHRDGWRFVTCITCNGTGIHHFRACTLCKGEGKIKVLR